MAHQIDTSTGEAAFYSHRQVPWHRLGTITEEALTADEALTAARLDWKVTKRPLLAVVERDGCMGCGSPIGTEHGYDCGFTLDRDDKPGPVTQDDCLFHTEVPGNYATVREDTGAALGVVGEYYEPLQNADAFGFLSELAAEDEAKIETAGALRGGSEVFISAYLPHTVTLDAGGAADQVEMYLMVHNSHDRSASITAAVTPIRPVCKNTVTLATRSARRVWKVRHTKNVLDRVAEARRALGLTLAYVSEFNDEATALIHTPMNTAEFDQLISSVFEVTSDAKAALTRAQDRRDHLHHLFTEAPTQANIRGTAWAAEQAVVEYLDWVAPVRARDSLLDDIRAQRALNEAHEETKTRTHRHLLTLVHT